VADELYDLGTRLFVIRTGGPTYDVSRARDWIAWRDDRNRANSAAPG
jgi:hypothetical protein